MTNSRQNFAPDLKIPVRQMCFVCQKTIADNDWFCRLPKTTTGADGREIQEIVLCSPACALRHFNDSQPNGNGFEPNYDGFEHSLEEQKNSKAKSAKNTGTKQ